MADPGFEGKTHFLGSLADAGFIGTPNDAPRSWESYDPISGTHDGDKTDTGHPMGQAQVGYRGVAGGHGGMAGGDGYSGKQDGCISGDCSTS